jgi:hypothetical protein
MTYQDAAAATDDDRNTVLINRVSWGAVLAGVVLGLVTQLILNLLGLGVGAATLDPGTGDNPSVAGLSIGAGIWWTVSGIVASFAGGLAAGRLAGKPKPSTGAWHGVIAWAFTTLIIFYLLTSTLGGVLGGAYRGLSGALGGVASSVGGAAQTAVQAAAPSIAQASDPFSSIEQSIRASTNGSDPAAMRDAAVAAVRAAVSGDQQQAQAAREQAAQALARAQNIPVEQARTDIQNYEQRYRQTVDEAKRRATEAAQAATTAVSRAALFSALGLILGALAALFGGRLGTVDPTVPPAGRPTIVSRRAGV